MFGMFRRPPKIDMLGRMPADCVREIQLHLDLPSLIFFDQTSRSIHKNVDIIAFFLRSYVDFPLVEKCLYRYAPRLTFRMEKDWQNESDKKLYDSLFGIVQVHAAKIDLNINHLFRIPLYHSRMIIEWYFSLEKYLA
jgi:hypothetical protein